MTWPTVQSTPQTFSVGTWFRTTTAGGRLIGFGDSATGASTTSNRQIYVNTAGQLVFGVRPRNVQTLTSAQVVTDGAWHHVAATFSTRTGLALYLDGRRVGTDSTVSSAQTSDGSATTRSDQGGRQRRPTRTSPDRCATPRSRGLSSPTTRCACTSKPGANARPAIP